MKDTIGLKIVYFGTGRLGVPTLKKLIELGSKPLLVITAPDRPAGRGLKLSHSEIKDLAIMYNIPILQPEDVNISFVKHHIKQYSPDIGVLIAYGQKIDAELINIFPYGIINLHASLLPKYRGAAPINWAIINGEKVTGLTVMQINEEIDAGKILNQIEVPINPLERADELQERLARMGPEIIIRTLKEIKEGKVNPREQDTGLVSKAPKLTKELSKIDWNEPAERIVCKIHGLWPWPGVRARYQPADWSKKPVDVSLARAKPLPETEDTSIEPGTILDDLTVRAGKGKVKLLEVKPAGRKLMKWEDFVNGRHVKPGDKLISI